MHAVLHLQEEADEDLLLRGAVEALRTAVEATGTTGLQERVRSVIEVNRYHLCTQENLLVIFLSRIG